MNSDELVADEVVSRSKLGWDRGGPFTGVKDGSETPYTIIHGAREQTGFIEFEPSSATACARAECARAFVEVYGDGARDVCPLSPVSGDLGTSGYGSREGGGCAAIALDFGV